LRKVLIFGNSGCGKTTLANKIVEEDKIAHLDLDSIAWLPTNPPQREALKNSKSNIEQFIRSNDGWVIEGCYSDLIELALAKANEVIFVNLNVEQCIANARNRPWEPHKYKSKEEQDNNLEMLLDWIKQYYNRKDVFSFSSHLKLFENFNGEKTMFTTNEI